MIETLDSRLRVKENLYGVTLEINVYYLMDREVRKYCRDNDLDFKAEWEVMGNTSDEIANWLCSGQAGNHPVNRWIKCEFYLDDFDFDPISGEPIQARISPAEFLRWYQSCGESEYFTITVDLDREDFPDHLWHPCFDMVSIEISQPHFALEEYAKTMTNHPDALVKEWR
jgi:hypothetical protein